MADVLFAPTLWQIIGLTSIGCLSYILVVSIYRITFHPLAKYPGPFFSKISSLSVFLQAITGDRHITSLKEHERYGPVVRIAPNQLSFNTASALKTIYQSGRQGNPLRKSPWYETIDAPSGAYSTHTEISRTKHAFRRRVLDHAFSDAALRSAETFVVENAQTLCKVLAEKTPEDEWSKPRNMSDYATYFAYDVMGDLVFGERFQCMTEDSHRFVPKLIVSSSAFVYHAAHLPFQWMIRPVISSPTLMKWFGGELAREEHMYVQYANDRVTARLAAENDHRFANDKLDLEADTVASLKASASAQRKDMMHYLLHARDPVTGQSFTRADLDADSSLLIAAGADTTSTVLAAAFFYLTLPHSTKVLSTLQAQLRNTFSSISAITSPQITHHPYLRAVIDEVLRLSPPVPTHLPRTIVQKPGLMIDSHFIPAGTIVGVPAYVLHHNESYFPDSWTFNPDRWIPSDSNTDVVKAARDAFCAFSVGSRGCVGKSLAYLELCIALGRVLYAYDIRRAQGTDNVAARKSKPGVEVRKDEFQLLDYFLAGRDGPMIEFRAWKSSRSGTQTWSEASQSSWKTDPS